MYERSWHTAEIFSANKLSRGRCGPYDGLDNVQLTRLMDNEVDALSESSRAERLVRFNEKLTVQSDAAVVGSNVTLVSSEPCLREVASSLQM